MPDEGEPPPPPDEGEPDVPAFDPRTLPWWPLTADRVLPLLPKVIT